MNNNYNNLTDKLENIENESRQFTWICILLLVTLIILLIFQTPKFIIIGLFASTLIMLFAKIAILYNILRVNNELAPFQPKRNNKKLVKAANNPIRSRGGSKYHG